MEGSAVHIGKVEVTGIFFELLQVAVGTRSRLSVVPTAEEWQALYDMAARQTLIGVCADFLALFTDLKEQFTITFLFISIDYASFLCNNYIVLEARL